MENFMMFLLCSSNRASISIETDKGKENEKRTTEEQGRRGTEGEEVDREGGKERGC